MSIKGWVGGGGGPLIIQGQRPLLSSWIYLKGGKKPKIYPLHMKPWGGRSVVKITSKLFLDKMFMDINYMNIDNKGSS